jgi:hypothetical protein
VSTSERGSHCMPSDGMQYVHRKLHRSVTEMRRSRMDPAERVDEIVGLGRHRISLRA